MRVAVVSSFAFLLHGEGNTQVPIALEGPSAPAETRPLPLPEVPLVGSPSPQDVAAQRFAADMMRLSTEADAVDRLWSGYKAHCGARGGRRHDFGREWFALWDRPLAPTVASPACGELLSGLLQSGESVRRQLRETRAGAQRAALGPGTEVGMLRWHSLQWSRADPRPARGETVGSREPGKAP